MSQLPSTSRGQTITSSASGCAERGRSGTVAVGDGEGALVAVGAAIGVGVGSARRRG